MSPQDYTQEYNLDGNLYQPADLSPAAITALHAYEKDFAEHYRTEDYFGGLSRTPQLNGTAAGSDV